MWNRLVFVSRDFFSETENNIRQILKIPLCRRMPVFWNPGYHFYQTEGWNRFNPFSFIKRGNTHIHVHKHIHTCAHTHTHTHKPIFTTISHLLVFYNVTHISKEFIYKKKNTSQSKVFSFDLFRLLSTFTNCQITDIVL